MEEHGAIKTKIYYQIFLQTRNIWIYEYLYLHLIPMCIKMWSLYIYIQSVNIKNKRQKLKINIYRCIYTSDHSTFSLHSIYINQNQNKIKIKIHVKTYKDQKQKTILQPIYHILLIHT